MCELAHHRDVSLSVCVLCCIDSNGLRIGFHNIMIISLPGVHITIHYCCKSSLGAREQCVEANLYIQLYVYPDKHCNI